MTENAPAPVADNAEPANVNAEAVAPEVPATEPKAEPTTSENVPEWRATLPEDIRNDPSITKFDTIEGLAKSYKNAQALIGADKVPVPKTDEDWDRWYKAAGRPENPEGYGFKAPEQLPEGVQYNEALDKRFAEAAHKSGMNGRQAESMRQWLMEIVKEGGAEQMQTAQAALAEQEKARADGERELKAEWGNAYDQRTQVAAKAMQELWEPEMIARIEAAGLGNDPVVVKSLYKSGIKLIGEKNLIGDARPESSPGDLDSAIADHRSKYAAELMDKAHPDHATRVQQLTNLYNKRFG